MPSIFKIERNARGKIFQNDNGQYFFVCDTCLYEFITIESFENHQKIAHRFKEPPKLTGLTETSISVTRAIGARSVYETAVGKKVILSHHLI